MCASLALAAACLALAVSPEPQASLRERGAPGLGAIRHTALAAHVRFLSDDLLEGRGTGSRGHALAERYVAGAFEALGLVPIGERGTWFQDVPVRAWKVKRARSRFTLRLGAKLVPIALDRDYYLQADGDLSKVDAAAPVVFAGFGIAAPEHGWDDLAGLDLRGKVALVLDGAPASQGPEFFPSLARAVRADRCAKLQRLRRAGAVGVIVVHTSQSEKMLPWERSVAQAQRGGMVGVEAGRPATTPLGIPLRVTLKAAAFDRLLAAAGASVTVADLLAAAARRERPTLPRLDLRATAHVEVELRDGRSRNVLGMLPGREAALAAEPVLLAAHVDHLGVGPPVGGDAIYNGAADNATGVAEMIEAARAFAVLPDPPRRPVIFAALTGEEMGYLGSLHLAAHPLPAGTRYAAVVNVDEASWLAPLRDIVALGMDESTLGPHVQAAATALGLVVSPDPEPDQVYFVRGDHWSFAKAGVPGVLIFDGFLDETGATSRKQEAFERYERERYHSPRDEWDDSFNPQAMADFARAMFLIGLSIADDPSAPRWLDDSFLRRFGRGGPVPEDVCFPTNRAP